jgi:hypothetical protein
MKHKIKPIYLPTKKGQLYIHDGKLYNNRTTIPQHLYITVSQDIEPIKEGDNIFNKHMNRLEIASKNCEINLANDMHYNEGKTRLRDNILKVIAATDPKLTIKVLEHIGRDFKEITIPQIKQSFLKEFVADPNGEFKIKYKKGNYSDWLDNGGSPPPMKLRLNKNNTVNITSVEEKTYSTKEVEVLLNKAIYFGYSELSENSIQASDWIEKKLAQ